MFSDIKTLKAIANRTIYIGGKMNTKQKPPSVGAQFQVKHLFSFGLMHSLLLKEAHSSTSKSAIL
jgi:hypothetical protein